VKERLESLAGATLRAIDPAKVEEGNLDELERQLTAIKQAHPEIDRIFVVAHCPDRGKTFALFSTPRGITRIEHAQFKESKEAQSTLEAYQRTMATRTPMDASAFLWDQTFCLCGPFSDHEAGPFQLTIFSHVAQPDAKDHTGFAGLMVKSSYIEETLLPQVISELVKGSDLSAKDSALALTVFDQHGDPVYPSGVKAARPEVRLPFSPVFRKWELGIGYQDTTIDALAREHFQRNLLLTALTLALLILGLILTLRATTREMRLAQAKTTFVSNVSHELKTPLALIRLFAETLELDRVKSPERAREYYRIIHHESRRLTSLINNILDFSKIEAGRREYQFANADVAEVVAEVLGSYEYQLMSAGFEVKAEIQPHLPWALIDRDALAQAVLNLLNNAVKYSAETKEITVRVEARDGEIAISVADRGIGIPRSEHEKIFEKFYRVSTGLIHDTKGSGLGLALVKHIVEAHRGRIKVESAPDAGSCFTILLPISQAATSDSVIAAELPRAMGGHQIAEHPHH
jgi:signal transduction histidine kinase